MTESTLETIQIMIPGDLHLTESDLPNHHIANWVVDEANSLISPDFVQFIGDNVQHATHEQFELFQQLTRRLKSPWFALVGDHDRHKDPQASGFRNRFGNTWGSFRIAGFRFLRLNTQEAEPVGLSSEQLGWLRSELNSATEVGDRIVLFQHNYAYQIWEDFAGPGIDEWRSLVQSARIEAIFAGHTHYLQIANDGRNSHVAIRSIGDPEGGPGGYLLVVLRGPHLGMVYRTTEDKGPLVVILSPRQRLLCTGSTHVVSRTSEINVSIHSRHPVVQVLGQIDDAETFTLEKNQGGIWNVAFNSEWLNKGSHQLVVRAIDEFGVAGEQSIEFVVDQTGRYTAVPAAFPIVNRTQFC